MMQLLSSSFAKLFVVILVAIIIIIFVDVVGFTALQLPIAEKLIAPIVGVFGGVLKGVAHGEAGTGQINRRLLLLLWLNTWVTSAGIFAPDRLAGCQTATIGRIRVNRLRNWVREQRIVDLAHHHATSSRIGSLVEGDDVVPVGDELRHDWLGFHAQAELVDGWNLRSLDDRAVGLRRWSVRGSPGGH